jgi:hypothetical protein
MSFAKCTTFTTGDREEKGREIRASSSDDEASNDPEREVERELECEEPELELGWEDEDGVDERERNSTD